MKILKILPQKYKKFLRTVILEESLTLHLHEEVLAKYDLSEGTEIRPEKIGEIERESRRREALDYAYALLNYRALSEDAMKDRLKRKGFNLESIEKVIEDLKSKKLLNDADLAQDLALSRIKSRLLGNERVKEDLIRKGIEKSLADETVGDLTKSPDLPDEEERAVQLILKREKQIKAIDARTLFQRLSEYLARRGFNPDTIERALSRYRRSAHKIDKIEEQ